MLRMNFSLLLLFFIDIFCLLIFLMHIFFALSSPFQKQSSTQRCAPCCELCDHLKRNASFETYNSRRSWRVMILLETHRGLERLSLSVVWSEDPSEAMAILMLGGNKFWFCIVPRWLPQVISFPTGLSPRTMQGLGSV